MLGAAVIVFRESFEAALLIGIVAAATRALSERNRWVMIGIVAGALGSILVAGLADVIARLADGIGQEVFNAGILAIAIAMLGWHNIWMSRHGAQIAAHAKSVARSVSEGRSALSAIAVLIAIAVLREGSETVLFLYGLASGGNSSVAGIAAGGALGLAGGVAVGAIMYFGLVRIPMRWIFAVTGALILFLAAGMAGQMARFLVQADLISVAGTPLWDTGSLLPVDSPLGAVLHVLIGYEARPSVVQVAFYAITFTAILIGMHWARPRPLSAHSH